MNHEKNNRLLNLDRLSISHGPGDIGRPGVSGKSRDEGSRFNQSPFSTQKSFNGKGPKGYRRADSRIHDEVCEALTLSREVDASDIEVEVHEGVVTLKGSVPHRSMKKDAEWCIEEMKGVVDVFNMLLIGTNSNHVVKELIENQ